MKILVNVNRVKKGDAVIDETSKEAPSMLQQTLHKKKPYSDYSKCNNRWKNKLNFVVRFPTKVTSSNE